jgi:hypothetical protein
MLAVIAGISFLRGLALGLTRPQRGDVW